MMILGKIKHVNAFSRRSQHHDMADGLHGSQLAGTKLNAQMAIKRGTATVTIRPQHTVATTVAEVAPNRQIAMNVSMATGDASIDVLTMLDPISVAAILGINLRQGTGNNAIVSVAGFFGCFFVNVTFAVFNEWHSQLTPLRR